MIVHKQITLQAVTTDWAKLQSKFKNVCDYDEALRGLRELNPHLEVLSVRLNCCIKLIEAHTERKAEEHALVKDVRPRRNNHTPLASGEWLPARQNMMYHP
jgi:hypothetical protein